MDPRLAPHAEKLKEWLLAEEGFGEYVYKFFRENKDYFDDYNEEHALYYTTLHKAFTESFETEVQGWLRDEGLGEEDLEALLQQGRGSGDPEIEAVVDTMLNVLEYDKWIQNIFQLKRRIRDRPRKVRRAAG
eukprot:TRINITY_DN41974_c0_g1_i1.p1 TRINITY_DN41974_c0_g1~~TRINITY_DN41974_c0_g1_i1.p1  ORF type:complete len:150 (-),score=33.25 TRINITY_DN41974_c0_g1_i1:66-461(-)